MVLDTNDKIIYITTEDDDISLTLLISHTNRWDGQPNVSLYLVSPD